MSVPTVCEDKSATFSGWAYSGSTTVKPWQYHPRPLGPKDVEITHGGCCGSDVHLVHGRMAADPTIGPIIPGHEIVGKITAAGAKSHHHVGDLVGASPLIDSCLNCDNCKNHYEQFCTKRTFVYNDRFKDERGGVPQGGYADRVRINGDFVHKIPASISAAEAAPLFCAGLTTFSPLREHGAGPSKSVGVIGIGGLGHLTIQWAAAMKCKEVIAFSTSNNKRDEAKKLGATRFVNSKDPEEYKAAMHSVDILLVAGLGRTTDWNELLGLVADRGTFVLLAVPESPFTINAFELLLRQVNVTGSLIGGRKMAADMLEFAAKHNVRPWIEKKPMTEVNQVLDYVNDGKPRYRVVMETEAASRV
ncbi:hypothetical protein BGZ59_001074 [Podila verticillata]|nr:hypothetical protein BGZ59_001074 [Podila verticillata]